MRNECCFLIVSYNPFNIFNPKFYDISDIQYEKLDRA